MSIDIFKTHIDEDKPAILLLGKDFKSNAPLGEQIKQLLDVPSDWSLVDFLGALNTAAKIKNAKAILLIDGLNESVYWRDVWGNALENLITEIKLKYSNLLLITTYRTSYEEQLFPKHYFTSSPEAHDRQVEVYGYNFNVHEAIIRYFTYYEITPTNYSNTFNHFAEPLYLKIFCETKQGQTVSFADDDLFEVLDQYLQRCNENILHLLNKEPRYNKYFLQYKLAAIADYLWASNSRDIPLSKVVGNDLNQKELAAIEHENLLIFRDWDQREVLSFTYDLLSGYLIATQLIGKLNSEDQLNTFIGSADFNNKLLGSSTQHPLYSDILRCFCVLAIKKFGLAGLIKLNNPVWSRDVLLSLYEINVEYVKYHESVIKNFITSAFKKTDNQELIFAQSSSVEFDTQHPLNFAFTSSLIQQLSVADRDLGWTEFIRKNYSSYSEYDIKKFLRDFEQAVKGGEELSDRIHLKAEKVKWLLTSTNRELRDTATRALYFYGRQFPTDFSTLVFESLSINDPYVWERTLASLYGVVMAEHNSLTSSNFRDNILSKIGRELYKLIFQENASYATTHILARDYAKRTIDICLLYHHKQFSKTEIQSLRESYKGGIRDWDEYDFDRKEHSCEGPIHMDFSNYTIGTIVKDGGSYSDPPEKQKVRRQIYWRIFDLGWQGERFEKAERAIGNQNHSRSDQAKIERYGKKYSWIAFFEIAGYRDDIGLLDNDWNRFRISYADIDPSFPIKLKSEKFIQSKILEDEHLPLKEWYLHGKNPEVKEYLIAENLIQHQGKWVCLDGSDFQRNEELGREMFAFVRGILIKEQDYPEAIKLLKEQRLGRWLPNKRNNLYSFASELYNCPDAAYDNYVELEFITDRRMEKVRIGDPNYYPLMIMEESEGNLMMKMHYPEEIETEVRSVKTFESLFPVMEYNWESDYHDPDQAGHQTIVAKELATHLGLIDQPQTFDLFERTGEKASINIGYYNDDGNSHSLVYLRKDLFDKFLTDKGFRYVWTVWGRRQINYEKSDDFFAQEDVPDKNQYFQEIVEYDPKL